MRRIPAPIALALLVAAAGAVAEPRPLTVAEARRQVELLVPGGQRLITAGGAADVLLYDLDGDSHPEAFALTVDAASGSPASMEELSRYGRLFETEGTEGQFRLLAFSNLRSTLSLARVVDLGRWRVLATTDLHRISRQAASPVALSYVFQTVGGADHVWLAFFADPAIAPSRAVFRESVSSEVSSLDLDADGLLDIVVSERVRERSERSETYLTWYRWSGREFREHASTVIVRTLARFLAETRTQLMGRAFDELVRDALEPQAVQRLRGAGLTAPQIIARFYPAWPELDSIRDVVLPDVTENPFRVPSDAPPSVTLDVRIVDASGASHFAQIVVAISRNPFVPRPFTLLPARGGRPL